MNIQKSSSARNAILIGTLCSVSYLGVYFARNILSVVTPQIIEGGVYTEEYIGSISSMFFTFYAVGQLINGLVGDKIEEHFRSLTPSRVRKNMKKRKTGLSYLFLIALF